MNRRLPPDCPRVWLAFFFLATRPVAWATTYDVGPDKPLSAISQVPWESLQAGDTVLIHWRAEPYKEKWVICRQGKADAPITVRGVPGTNGQLPIIDGNGATTRSELNYWGGVRSVLKIGGARNPPDTMPKYIVIENLDIRNGRPPLSFKDATGKVQAYVRNAAAIHIEKGEHVTIRNCILHDCGNGLVTSSNDQQASRDILVEGSCLYDNGNPGSGYEHNVYTESIGMTYQFNRFGPLRAGAEGNNLKDRSAGLVVRYNWIVGGDKELDLVDGEDSALVRQDPRYRKTFVYGNVIIKPDGPTHPHVVHYGGDGERLSTYRKGTLYFYNNTVVSLRYEATILFRLSSDEESCDCRNNILYVVTGPRAVLGIVENRGVVNLSHNWLKRGWAPAFMEGGKPKVHGDGTATTGDSPGFVDLEKRDFGLTPSSPCRGRAVIPDTEPYRSHPVDRQYVKHRSSETRPKDGALDIGAFGVSRRSEKR